MSDIVITEKQVEEWQEEKAELEDTIQELQAKLDFIILRLDALRLFHTNRDEPIGYTFEPPPLTGPTAILHVMEQAGGGPMRPKDIKAGVLKTDFPREKWGTNFGYFYTALKRLFDSKKIHKDRNGYFLPLPAIARTQID